VSTSWPLSGAATMVLFDPESVVGSTVFKLGLKELVLRGVWVLRSEESKGLFGRRSEQLVIEPGRRAAPAIVPLPGVDAVVRPVAERRTLRAVVAASFPEHRTVGDRLRDEVREDLAARGLIAREQEPKLGGRVQWATWRRTPEGDRALRDLDALRGGLATATPASLGGLLVVLGPAEVAAVPRTGADDEVDLGALALLGRPFDKAFSAGTIDASPG
jgi:hypothetical protein